MDRRSFLLALASLPAWRAEAEHAVAEAVEFPAVLPGRKLVFPADHGAHPDFRTEWWYATGWLSLADGSPLGFQCTFFRVRTGIGEDNPSAFAPRQLVLAHAAIADPRLGRLRHEQRVGRAGFGRAGFATGQTGVWIGDWRLDQREDRYQAEVRGEDFAYALSLVPDGPPLRNGIGGFSAKSPDARHASYYYSRPQLKASGQVTLDGRQQQASGLAWLDHEWSSELLPPLAQGWDWIGINLADGSALMAFQLRTGDGAALWSAATLRLEGKNPQTLPPEAVAFTPLRHWRSARTGISYPVEWRVRIGARRFHLVPLLDDQELDSRRSTGTVYWEGAVRVVEDDREIGRGYLEMTGYGERIRLG
ncbi:MAG: carotenoid 1,2-hydratase [Propionivibrio sp.]|uniref:lipocalin-like domain-containing protein n=1 Tax=Propionivibrio sp. TaxID=2212460 RepID=UPI0025E3DDDA|nr:lipocalin-like domain-containing protein [Propionivibrio sp.]MBK8895582.1 carotenoid 1,2-hydratase [Propionivibrio sp.]MBL0206793.1 carotenoid 1,2-hydratase [Propionivibrio sp.]